MKPKTYRGRTMKEALAQVRRDLGGDAVILNTREVRGRRLFGLGRGERIEVVATNQNTASVAVAVPNVSPIQARLNEQLSQIHAMVEGLSRHGRIDHLLPDLPTELIPTYSALLEQDVPEVLARR